MRCFCEIFFSFFFCWISHVFVFCFILLLFSFAPPSLCGLLTLSINYLIVIWCVYVFFYFDLFYLFFVFFHVLILNEKKRCCIYIHGICFCYNLYTYWCFFFFAFFWYCFWFPRFSVEYRTFGVRSTVGLSYEYIHTYIHMMFVRLSYVS